MKIKELQKTVNIAWSPLPQDPIYLAAGTAAQQFDSNVNSTLEIYSTNFSDPSYDLGLKASTPSQYRYVEMSSILMNMLQRLFFSLIILQIPKNHLESNRLWRYTQ